jgi:hypothetical protein
VHEFRDSGIWKKRAEPIHVGGIVYNGDLGLKLTDLIRQEVDVAAGDERKDTKTVAILSDNVQCAGSDGTG